MTVTQASSLGYECDALAGLMQLLPGRVVQMFRVQCKSDNSARSGILYYPFRYAKIPDPAAEGVKHAPHTLLIVRHHKAACTSLSSMHSEAILRRASRIAGPQH